MGPEREKEGGGERCTKDEQAIANGFERGYCTLRSSSTMRGALMEATLPVVMRTTCVCPSHLLSAAVKRFVMWYLDKPACQ